MEILLPTPNLNTLPLDITCTDQRSVWAHTVLSLSCQMSGKETIAPLSSL